MDIIVGVVVALVFGYIVLKKFGKHNDVERFVKNKVKEHTKKEDK